MLKCMSNLFGELYYSAQCNFDGKFIQFTDVFLAMEEIFKAAEQGDRQRGDAR